MRPSVDEQLRETRRILDGLAPQLDGYAVQILRLALSNLAMLETAWTKVLPFLHRDNDTTLSLLGELRGDVGEELASAIDDEQRAPACDPFDVAALEARNERLQSLVVRAIGRCDAAGRRGIRAALLERTARYPMRPAKARPVNDTGG